jgi:hypothetical protein
MKCNIFNYKYAAQNHNNNNSIQFSMIYVLSEQLQRQLQKQHSANVINYTTHKEKQKYKSHEASLGTTTLGKLLFLLYTTKKIIWTIGARKPVPTISKVILRKPVHVILNNSNSVNFFLSYTLSL